MNNDKNIQKIIASAFLHKDGKLFVARRADTKKFLPGRYELPGGHIEHGETMEDGLRREIMEEFGFEAVVGDPFYVFTGTRDEGAVHFVEVDYFVTFANTNQKIQLNPKDHSQYRWITQEEILSFFDENDEEGRAIRKGFEILDRIR